MKLAVAFALLALPLAAQKYRGPVPEKADVPYLMHADTLLLTEVAEAKEETRKDELVYAVPGASSQVRTPLASPMFAFKSDKIPPEKLEVFRLTPVNGRREIAFSKKKKNDGEQKQFRLSVERLDGNLYKLEVVESLPNGEYSITPNGSNQVFLFQIY